MQKLNIVDENDVVIGIDTRENIHKLGLLHRETNVYFVMPQKGVIFQRRSISKETSAGLLAATVGGHVEIGDSYIQTAIKETEEETGLKIKSEDLIFINKTKQRFKDENTGVTNYRFNSGFLYIFKGRLEDLKIELGEGEGFEVFKFEELVNLSDEEKENFSPNALSYATNTLREFIKDMEL